MIAVPPGEMAPRPCAGEVRREVRLPVTQEDAARSRARDHKIIGPPEDEAVRIGPKSVQRAFQLHQRAHRRDHVLQAVADMLFGVELPLRQAVEQQGRRDAERERDGDRKDLGVK